MLVRARAPHQVVTAFTGRRITSHEWSPVPEGCEAEAGRLASAGYLELQEQTEEKPEPVLFLSDSAVVEASEPEEPEQPPVDLASLSTKELRAMAKAKDVKGWGRMSKAKLIEALSDD